MTKERFTNLVETNVDRLFGYIDGKTEEIVLYLPVKEWNLPVATMGLSAFSKLTGETRLSEALVLLGMKTEQIKVTVDGLEQAKTYLGYLIFVWMALLLLTIGVLAGHYFFGSGIG